MPPETTILHATTVAVNGRGIAIIGPSGAGKSALALGLIALGAALVADDRTQVARAGGQVIASVPTAIAGLIEARHVGLIRMPHAGPTPLRMVVDLSRTETDRLPHAHSHSVLGTPLPCLHKAEKEYFPAAVLLYIKDNQRFPDA